MVFEDANLKLTLLSEDIKSYYTIRVLELESLGVSSPRLILLTPAVHLSAMTNGKHFPESVIYFTDRLVI